MPFTKAVADSAIFDRKNSTAFNICPVKTADIMTEPIRVNGVCRVLLLPVVVVFLLQ